MKKATFALIGMLVLVSIGTSIAVWRHRGIPRERTKVFRTVQRVARAHRLVIQMAKQTGRFPTEREWQGEVARYFRLPADERSWLFVDEWGSPLKYRVPGERNTETIDLYSFGPNRLDDAGGGDDIGNWAGGGWSGYDLYWAESSQS